MKCKILFLVVAFILKEGSGNMINFGDCTIDDRIDVIGGIIDIGSFNDDDGFSAEYPFTGPLVVEPADSEEYAKYIDILIDDTKSNLLIKTNEAFTNFEEDYKDKDTFSPWLIQRTVQLRCGSRLSALILRGYLIDTNNHPPKFIAGLYTYIIPSPLVPNIDLTFFDEDQPIIVEDIDLSNKQIIFTSTDSVFELTTKDLTSKTHRAALKVKTLIQFDSDITFTLTATDEGTPTLLSDVTVTIKKDQSNSLPNPPSFSDALFQFEYSEFDGIPVITAVDGKDIIVATTNPDNTDVVLSDDTYQDYVNVQYDKATGRVIISATDKTIETAIFLKLKATLETSSVETAIVITLPKTDTVRFSDALFEFEYSEFDGIPIITSSDGKEIIVTTTDPDNTYIICNGCHEDYIQVLYDTGTGEVIISSTGTKIPPSTQPVISFTLKATVGESSSETAIIITLPPSVVTIPKFAAQYYTATYTVNPGDNDDTITISQPITVTEDAEVTLAGEYSDYFSIVEYDNYNWLVSVKTDLDEAAILKGEDIILILEGKAEHLELGYSTLIVTLPKQT